MKLSLSFLKVVTLVLCVGVSVFVTGCAGINGIGSGNGGVTSATGAVSTFSGKTYGGFNPISGAAIDLYAAGTSYGAATLVAATSSGSDGRFALSYDPTGATNSGTGTSYNCSAAGVTASTQMYLTSTGGNTANSGGTSGNSAAVLMVALGPCAGLETTGNVTINEATTVAMVYAMQQFMNVTSSGVFVGAPASPALTTTGGLALAYQTATLLVNPGTGTINSSSTPSGSVSNVTMTVTPESAKITSLANVLSNCVNQTDASATACTSLFGEIKSPSIQMTPVSGVPVSTAPTDTAMAAWYLAMNPAQLQKPANVASLYTASTGYEAFGVGGLSAAPTDWTVDVVYSAGTSTCGYTLSSTSSGTTQPFGSPSQMAIDANGNIWVSNTRGYVSGSLGVPAYVQVSNTGALTACVATFTNTSGNATTYYNGYEYYADPQEYYYPSVVVDTKNNVWYSSETGGVFELPNGSTSPVQATATGASPFYASQLLPLANGDIIANSASSPSTTFDYVNAATSGASVTPTSFPFAARSAGFAAVYPYGSTASTTPNIMSMGTVDVYQMLTTGTDTWSSSTLTATSATAVYSSSSQTTNCNVMVVGIAPDYQGNAVGTTCAGPSGGSGKFSSWYLLAPGSSTPTVVTSSTTYLGGLNGGSRPAVDSLHHVWSGTQLPVATGGVYAFASMYWNGTSTTSATNLSPSGSAPSGGCSYTACLSGGGFQHSNITGPIVDTAIDQAGNVWGLMGDDTTSNFATKGLVEVVGAAAPVVTPLVNGLIQ